MFDKNNGYCNHILNHSSCRSLIKNVEEHIFNTNIFNTFCNIKQLDFIPVNVNFPVLILLQVGTRWRSWFRHCTTSRKVVGLISEGDHWSFSVT